MAGAAPPQLLRLRFANGEELAIDATNSRLVPHRYYALPVPFIRSGRIFEMVVRYVSTHAAHQRGGAAAVPDIGEWDRLFMAEIVDTDTLYDVFLVASTMGIDGLTNLCADRTADAVKGSTVDEVKLLLNIDTGLDPVQELEARSVHENILLIR